MYFKTTEIDTTSNSTFHTPEPILLNTALYQTKNVFGPIAVLVTNRFRLEQKSYLPLKLQFMSGFGKTTIFNGLLGVESCEQ
jgi:hypothetical protein